MKVIEQNGQDYHLPNSLNTFQQSLYIHLIDWKWAHITREAGINRDTPYDAILPEQYADQYPMLYPDIIPVLKEHLQKFPFRIHKYFNHMASSQAANLNLFLPVLRDPNANAVFAQLKPDFARLATDQLDHGYRVEFWDEPFGNLGDKTEATGTDTDIAIAYYNHQDELCLWLIEHKLTEAEFTTCGGFRSKGRGSKHDCSKPFADILVDKQLCYYHEARHYKYWHITEANQTFFSNHAEYAQCPFQGGMNQLWRNQVLGLSIEQDERQPYKNTTFSVVKHPHNTPLDKSLAEYQQLIDNNSSFFVFTSKDICEAAAKLNDPILDAWITWYQELYALQG
jgi:hypothetical protein